MSNCEIVDNVACGVSFQYCRTHKVEPKDCPGAAVADPGNLINAVQAFKDIYDQTLAASSKREFQVGDKVRCISIVKDFTFWSEDWVTEAGIAVGGVYTVESVSEASIHPSLMVREAEVPYSLPQSCFEVVE